MRSLSVLGLLLLLVTGCAENQALARDTVLNRSSREWDCPAKAIKVRALGGRAYEAKGCRQRATYICGYARATAWDVPCRLESRDGVVVPPWSGS